VIFREGRVAQGVNAKNRASDGKPLKRTKLFHNIIFKKKPLHRKTRNATDYENWSLMDVIFDSSGLRYHRRRVFIGGLSAKSGRRERIILLRNRPQQLALPFGSCPITSNICIILLLYNDH